MIIGFDDLLRALDRDEVIPYFQPVVELRTGRLVGFEALARWVHPTEGACLPSNFIQLAEQNGLIGTLAHQMFLKAFKAIVGLPGDLTLAVNVSPIQLLHATLPKQIQGAAEEAGFPLERLTVEITESALATNIDRALKTARELKALGCRLALDDFGTGFSSLGSLQMLPFDELKIDRSFVESMTEKRESRKIVAAITGLGSSLGIVTVGEGVETEEQAEMLLLFSCNHAQGWLYGGPVPASEMASVVAASPWVAPRLNPELAERWEGSSLEALPTQRLSQLQAIYNGAPVGLAFVDCNLRYINLNWRFAEMNGLPVSAHLGRTVKEVLPELFSQVESYLERALLGEAIQGVEVTRLGKGGAEPRTILESYHPARDESGEVIGVSIAAVDISERKHSEDVLEESVFLHQHMAGICGQLPWTMNGDGKGLQVGSQLGDPLQEVGQHPEWLTAVHPEDRVATIEAMRDALHMKVPIDLEYRVMSADRGWRWVRCRASPRMGPNGQVVRWYGGVEDIQRAKEIEQELRASRAVEVAREGAAGDAPAGKTSGKVRHRKLPVGLPDAGGVGAHRNTSH